MGLTIPRDLVFDMYLGRWVEVTALPEGRGLRQTDPVAVSWGLPNEQGKALAPPSTVEALLSNTGGHWTPGNPMSDYYDYLQGRNVPTRLGLRVSQDTGSRTVSNGWGFTDTGDGWNVTGGGGAFAVGSGVRTTTISAANSFELAFLGDSYTDCQVADTASWNLNVAGGAIEPLNLVLRYQPSGAFAGEHYLLRVSVSAAEVLTVAIFHSSLGLLSSTVTVATLTPGANSYRGKFQVEGESLRGKVYVAGPAEDPDLFEPLGWQVSAHHERLSGGFPGVRTGVAAGNTNVPVTISYDTWVLTLMRHSGELAKLQPTWDLSHKIKKATIKCADITQRLGRPQRPALSSAPRRYLASNAEFTATDHWPLDESVTAPAQGVNTVAGGAPARFLRETGVSPNRGAVKWGEADRFHTAVPGFATLSNGGRLAFTTQQAALGSAFSIMFAVRLSPDAGGQVFLSTAATANRFVFFLYTDGTFELFSNPSGGTLLTGVLSPAGLDGRWVTLGLLAFPSGGDTDCRVFVDGQNLGGGLVAADPGYSALQEALVHVPQPTTGGQGDSALSTVFVTGSRFDTVTGGLTIGERAHTAIMGWRGERGGLRAFRLCAEEGVPFDYWGDLGQTRAMGPQRPLPLLDQLQECADGDGAILYGPRYTPGIAFRGRRAMCARPADATLSYSSGHVAPEFAQSADDRPSANLVRAERIDGGFLIVEQTTGPMNTKDPGTDPEAIGRSPADAKANVESDALLGDLGGWVRALGTTPEVRFPRVTVDLAARELTTGVDPTLPARQIVNLHPGDRLQVTGLAAADVHRDLDQLVRGGKETFRDRYGHKVTLNTAPYEKYRAGVFGEASSRYDGAVTTLDAQLAAGVTGARNVTTSAGEVWTTAAGAFPLDVIIGGERCTVSGIAGAGAAQSMTISVRNVNGLPAAGGKTHPAGTRVYLFQPVYYC